MKGIPFLRIVLPYVAGVICLLQGVSIPWLHVFFVCSFVIICVAFVWRKTSKQVYTLPNAFFVAAFYLFFFFLAFEAATVYCVKTDKDHYSHYVDRNEQFLMATVAEMPVSTTKSLKLQLLLDAIERDGSWHYTKGRIPVYVKQPVSRVWNTGDRILIKAKLSAIAAPQNPGELDYRQYLERRNVFHSAYVLPEAMWLAGPDPRGHSLARFGIAIREQVVKILREAGLSLEAFSICTALLVGYDDEISGDVMQSFSHSGTLHILSVSGMHTGILYMVLMLLCNAIDRDNRYPIIRCAVVIAVMLLFAAITGFSPSVLRAVLMLVLILIGKTIKRNGNPYNTLLFSAFLLLLYDPFLMADVGFLLSYLAVGGIMYLYPLINNRWCPENRILKFCWDICLMSVAATLFTLPLTLYCFHQFPLWFLLSNLIIIPLSTALMAAAFLLLVVHKILILKQGLVLSINAITTVMLRTAQLTDDPVYGYIDHIPFDAPDVLFSSLLILLILWFSFSKSYRVLSAALVCGTLWAATSALMFYRQSSETELVVFSVRHRAVYLLRAGHEAYLQADSLTDNEFRRYVQPYLLQHSGLQVRRNQSRSWQIAQKRIVNMRGKPRSVDVPCDYLIVSYNTPLRLDSLQQIKPLVIADCSNSYTFVKKLKKQCDGLGLSFYSLKEKGALVIPF